MDFDGDAGSPGVRVQPDWPSEFDSEMGPIKKRLEALPLFISQQLGTWSDFSLLENLVRKQFKSRAWFKPISRSDPLHHRDKNFAHCHSVDFCVFVPLFPFNLHHRCSCFNRFRGSAGSSLEV